MSQISQVSRIALVFVFVFVNLFGHVMSSHHFEQMSQRSQVSRIAFRSFSQNVFVFVFVNFFGHVMSSHHYDQMSQFSQVSKIAL